MLHGSPPNFFEYEGKDPREGNKVVAINVHEMYVTWIGDTRAKFKTYDPVLYWKAVGESFVHAPIGPGFLLPLPPSGVIRTLYTIFEEASRVKAVLEHGRFHAWVVAAKSSTGYQFLEYDESRGEIIIRTVENLNPVLGVEEGFENVVTEKMVFDTLGNLKRIEFWNYVVREEGGKKKVYFEHLVIDRNARSTPGLKRSGWREAIPKLYSPDDERGDK